MAYKPVWTRAARERYDQLPPEVQYHVASKVQDLANDPQSGRALDFPFTGIFDCAECNHAGFFWSVTIRCKVDVGDEESLIVVDLNVLKSAAGDPE